MIRVVIKNRAAYWEYWRIKCEQQVHEFAGQQINIMSLRFFFEWKVTNTTTRTNISLTAGKQTISQSVVMCSKYVYLIIQQPLSLLNVKKWIEWSWFKLCFLALFGFVWIAYYVNKNIRLLNSTKSNITHFNSESLESSDILI